HCTREIGAGGDGGNGGGGGQGGGGGGGAGGPSVGIFKVGASTALVTGSKVANGKAGDGGKGGAGARGGGARRLRQPGHPERATRSSPARVARGVGRLADGGRGRRRGTPGVAGGWRAPSVGRRARSGKLLDEDRDAHRARVDSDRAGQLDHLEHLLAGGAVAD